MALAKCFGVATSQAKAHSALRHTIMFFLAVNSVTLLCSPCSPALSGVPRYSHSCDYADPDLSSPVYIYTQLQQYGSDSAGTAIIRCHRDRLRPMANADDIITPLAMARQS